MPGGCDVRPARHLYYWTGCLASCIIRYETVYLGLGAAARYEFVSEEFGGEHLAFLAAGGESAHADDVGIIAEPCPLGRVYV